MIVLFLLWSLAMAVLLSWGAINLVIAFSLTAENIQALRRPRTKYETGGEKCSSSASTQDSKAD